ncbi:5-oxoprolinase subunit C family protein [Litchfieldia alkalitelluris]|uniref:5-oxoprolinase subunit C family protein n=1 Tax=Litchfieldia alkalitelluris TaxID=304268 RepID=UPI0009988E07|nr:biotin-dependent carboxyltransferase family protein [Litchfieldia alkalitelluris]
MLKVIKPGLLSTLQDKGRVGYQKFGVVTNGAMDPLAHRLANILVGNQENEATLECTMVGPVVHFESDTLISICGAEMTPTINGVPVKLWRPVLVYGGSVLKFGHAEKGCRAYLAVAGGYHIQSVMESKSTYLRAKFGGYHGRTLQSGDILKFGEMSELSQKIFMYLDKSTKESPASFSAATWSVSQNAIPFYKKNPLVRIIGGRQFHLFSEESKNDFLQSSYKITSQSDRMGYRLNGPLLKLETGREMLSEAVSFGTVQVPADGQPIILMADRQTTGGYPKIAQIITVDLPAIAQASPNEEITFLEISHQEAEQLLITQEETIAELKQGVLQPFLNGKAYSFRRGMKVKSNTECHW